MPGTRDQKHQVHWWLDRDLIAAIKAYQHAQRLDSLTEAADRLLRAALAEVASPPHSHKP